MANWAAVTPEFAARYPGEPRPLLIGWRRLMLLLAGLPPDGIFWTAVLADRERRERAALFPAAIPRAEGHAADYRWWYDALDSAIGRRANPNRAVVTLDDWVASGEAGLTQQGLVGISEQMRADG